MEGVPRLYMIGLPAKQCVTDRKPDFASTINYYIHQSYERDPNLYSTDVDMLKGLRQSAMGAVMSAASTVDDCTVLKRYYVQLIRLTEKFPGLLQQSCGDIEKEAVEKTTMPLTFTWYRNLGGKANKDVEKSVVDYGNIEYEMQCVLYNVGAAHSRLAAAQDRSPTLECSGELIEGTESSSTKALKVACTHLQCAAWAFQQLLGSGGNNNENCDPQKPLVTNRTVLEFAFNVMLAQAQECILEKSMMDGRKPLIIAKVSAMICEYFATAIGAVRRMEHEPNCVSTYRFEKWKLYSEFKCRYYGSVTALFQGQHVQDQLQQMGTRVSFYRRSLNLLNRACVVSEQGANTLMALAPKDEDIEDDDYYYYLQSKDSQNRSQYAIAKELEMRRDTLSFAMDVAGAKWRAAKSENELIYHESVVPVSSDDDDTECIGSNLASTANTNPQLEKVKGASLVKPIGFGLDDTELLVVVVTNKDSPCESTTTTLFRDLVPAATRHRAEIYQTEKRSMLAELQSLCNSADDRLSVFMDTLNLECLEMYKEDVNSVERNNVLELPQQLVNCCASYQALLLQKQQERGDTPFSDDDEDHLDADMARLSAAVQAVDGMLDEIDRLLKTEELGDSEYRRTMGRPYDYSAGRMRELRREASRYREAHVGRARDSWVTLSRAVRERRRRDLELLALPPNELAARLPPAQPTRSAISAEVAASGDVDSSTPMDITTCSAESTDQNDTESDDGNSGCLRQRDSLKRLDRLYMVVSKLQEVKNQRQTLLTQLRGEMDQEDSESMVIGQDDADVMQGTEDDITVAVKKKLDERYGNLVNHIDRNLTAQLNIVDAVMTAYARAAPERRAYSNAMHRRQTVIASLLDAYESFATANGGMSMASDYEPLLPNSGLLPDAVLAERCTKGLEFYQRLVTNVSKLLQRVKGTCQVQTEQRDQIIKQHQQLEVETLKSDLIRVKPEYQLPNAPADDIQEGMANLIAAGSSSSESNNPLLLMRAGHWDDQQYHLQRLSPLGSEQHYHQYQQHQTQSLPPLSTYNTTSDGNMEYYDYYHNDCQSSTKSGYNANVQPNSVNQHPLVTASMATYALATNAIGSTVGLGSVNPTTVLTAPVSMYNYYNCKLPTDTIISSLLPSASSYNNSGTSTGHSNDVATAALMNALRLTNNNENCQHFPSYNTNNPGSSVGSDSNAFRNIPATVAAYGVGVGGINDTNNINSGVSGYVAAGGGYVTAGGGYVTAGGGYVTAGGGYVAAGGYGGFQNSTTMSQLQQYYSHQYQQQISTAATVANNVSNVGRARFFVRQRQHHIVAGVSNDSDSSPFSSSSILSATGILSAVQQSPVNDTSNMANLVQHSSTQQQIHMYNQQQQQSQLLYKQQQQSQYSQLYQQQQQQQQFYQQQIYQRQQSLLYSQQQQQQQQQQISGTAANFYYASQIYQPQNVQLTTNSTLIGNIPVSNSGNYYVQQQYNMPTSAALNTATMTSFNNYFYQPQYYQQGPTISLIDDDLLQSGPPPIQPEKIDTISILPTTNCD